MLFLLKMWRELPIKALYSLFSGKNKAFEKFSSMILETWEKTNHMVLPTINSKNSKISTLKWISENQ